jgi:hypothetical protein
VSEKPDRPEFGSPEWLQMVCDYVEKRLAGTDIDLSGVNYTWGEEFFNVPGRLNPTGAQRVGWYVQVHAGRVQTAIEPPPPDADSNNVADWDAIEYLCHHVFGVDPEADEAVANDTERLQSQGKLERVVRREMPEPLVLALDRANRATHNNIVAMTGPRRS